MKTLSALTLCLALLWGLSACNAAPSTTYNEHPDLSKKVVGSKNLAGAMIDPIDDMAELVSYADGIIVGKVLDGGTEEAHNPYGYDARAEEIKQQMLKQGQYVEASITVSQVRVLEVLQGDWQVGDVIQLVQPGKPHTPDFQTKVEQGEQLLMLLRNGYADGQYLSAVGEASLFYLDGHNKITSMSDELLCARYDGRSVDLLKTDLETAWKAAGKKE